ncbi:MAG: penicillin-binding transpeptidase domain-containing protein [Calditrichia bacterium]
MKKFLLFSTIYFLSFYGAYGQTNLSDPFLKCKLDGSITIYDYSAAKWISSDIADSSFPTLPASTFKVVNTLIALESGVIADENEIVKWPGSTDTLRYGYRLGIYHDMSMKEAFKVSAGWVYVELAKKIGKESYKRYLTEIGYGNSDLSIDDPDFWNFGNFAISPANQIKVLIGVYEETLPFKKESFKILKDMMIVEQGDSYTLRAKTGWTRDGGMDTGWWVGYVEKKDNVYFFATRLIKPRDVINKNFGSCRKQITRTILSQMGVLK